MMTVSKMVNPDFLDGITACVFLGLPVGAGAGKAQVICYLDIFSCVQHVLKGSWLTLALLFLINSTFSYCFQLWPSAYVNRNSATLSADLSATTAAALGVQKRNVTAARVMLT